MSFLLFYFFIFSYKGSFLIKYDNLAFTNYAQSMLNMFELDNKAIIYVDYFSKRFKSSDIDLKRDLSNNLIQPNKSNMSPYEINRYQKVSNSLIDE
jgi:hypothetical protein